MRFYLYKLFSVVFFFSMVQVAMAQEALTLKECREQAVEYNKQLKKAGYTRQEAEEQKKAAKTNYLPKFDAEVNLMHVRGIGGINMPGGFLPTAESAEAAQNGDYTGQSNVWSPGISMDIDNISLMYGGLNISQPIYAGGKINLGNKMAQTGVEIASMAYDLKYADVIELTDKAFWNVAMVEANISLAEKYIEMLTELESQMNSMFEVGLQPASERLKVSVQKNQAELQLMMARNGLKLAKMNLNQVLGKELTDDFTITYGSIDNIQLIDLAYNSDVAQSHRNEIKILQKQVNMSEYNKKMTKADYLPQVGVGLQYTGTYVDDLKEDLSFTPLIAAQVSIPIFQWGQGTYKQKAAEYKISQQEEELSNTIDLINLEILSVKVKVEEAYEAILIAEKNVAEAEESLSETRSSFEVGINTTTDLLNAQADWLNAQAQQIKAIANYKVLGTTWEKVTGNLYTVDDL